MSVKEGVKELGCVLLGGDGLKEPQPLEKKTLSVRIYFRRSLAVCLCVYLPVRLHIGAYV